MYIATHLVLAVSGGALNSTQNNLLVGVTSSKSLRLCLQSDPDEIWHDCSSSMQSQIFDFTLQFKDGSHNVISHRCAAT